MPLYNNPINPCQASKNRENIKPGRTLAQLFAQAEGSHLSERVSRSGELLSPRRELNTQEQWLLRILT